MGRYAVGDHVVHLGMQLTLMREVVAARLSHDGACHAVREVFLDASGIAQDAGLVHLTEGKHLLDLGRRMGERSRLVEDDCVGSGKCLQVLAALHDDAQVGGLPHRAHHGHRGRELDRTGVVNHEDDHGLLDVARDSHDGKERKQVEGHERIRKTLCLALHTGLETRRLLDESGNAVDASFSRSCGHTNSELAFLECRPGIDRRAHALVHKTRLTRQRRLVEAPLTGDDGRVHRKDRAHAHAQ